jgi:hypothetical protein
VGLLLLLKRFLIGDIDVGNLLHRLAGRLSANDAKLEIISNQLKLELS